MTRIAGERAGFLEQSASYTPETPEYIAFCEQFTNNYIKREKEVRGIRDLNFNNLSNSEKDRANMIVAEVTSITSRDTATESINQRASETAQQETARMNNERRKFLDTLSQVPDTDRHSFVTQASHDYIQRESIQRGLEHVPYLRMTDEQISAYAKVRHEALLIYANSTETFENFRKEIAHDIAFKNAIDELGLPQINRADDAFSKFGSEKYDDMRSRYANTMGRLIKLDDILIIRGKLRSAEFPTIDPEYRVMLRLVSKEWEAWKRDNNVTE